MEERENETKNWLDAVIGFHTAEDGAAKRPPERTQHQDIAAG